MLRQANKYLKVWGAIARASFVREMEFRANFFLGLLRQLLWMGTFVFIVQTMFEHTTALVGWSKPQVLTIVALSRLIEGILNTLFTPNIMELPQLVQTGKFDFHLTKPLPTQLYTSLYRFAFYNIGNVLAGFLLLGFAVSQYDHLPSLGSFLLMTALAGTGIIIFYSLIIMAGSMVFFFERLEALWGFLSLFSEPLTVPFDIFPRVPRGIITYILPLAFIVLAPAQALTQKITGPQIALAVMFAVLFFTLSSFAWQAGLKRYTSASS